MQATLAAAVPAQETRNPQPERSAAVPPRLRQDTVSTRSPVPSAAVPEPPETLPTEVWADNVRDNAGAAGGLSAAAVEGAVVAQVHDAASVDGLRQYRQALAREARRYRQYPLLARSRGWEGTVEVRVQISGGQSPVVALARSSGHRLLDERALEMMAQAILVAVLPESLRGQSFSVPVPVQFVLGE